MRLFGEQRGDELHGVNAVEPQVERQQIGPVLAGGIKRGLARIGLAAAGEVWLRQDESAQAIAEKRVVIHDQNALFSHGR